MRYAFVLVLLSLMSATACSQPTASIFSANPGSVFGANQHNF